MIKIVEIFKSIDGEGYRAGLPVTFIRTFGCNLRCSYCDTKYSLEDEDAAKAGYRPKVMSVDEIVNKVIELDCGYVTITGGEPLIQPDMPELLHKLIKLDFIVNIETNGSINPYRKKEYKKFLKDVIFTFDYKTASSKMEDRNDLTILKDMSVADVLKFVVGKKDLPKVLDIVKTYDPKGEIFISPIFGEIEPKEIVEFILQNKELYHCRVQLQLHKYIWAPDQMGV